MTRRRRFDGVLIAVLLGSVGSGCRNSGGGIRSPHEQAAAPIPSAQRAGAAGGIFGRDPYQAVRMAFDVVLIQLPMEGLQHSRKIWNHVDTLRVGPEVAGRLARNGLRVGVVSPGAWPAMETIMDACDATTHRERTPAQFGLPLTMEVGAITASESIFSYGVDNRLVGKTFEEGKKLINIDYLAHPELNGSVDLQPSLEIRHDRGVMTWEHHEGVVQQVPAVDRYHYPEVTAAATLNPGEGLLIGPSEAARNEYLVGSRFLMVRLDGRLYETMLCITPIPDPSPIGRSP